MPSFKFILISVSTTALLGLSACATPTTQTASTPAAAAKTTMTKTETTSTASAESTGKQICRREAVVGSKFKKKICATQDVWDARAAADRKKTGDIQRGGSSVGTSN